MSTDIEKLVRDAVSQIVANDTVAAMSKIREKKKMLGNKVSLLKKCVKNIEALY